MLVLIPRLSLSVSVLSSLLEFRALAEARPLPTAPGGQGMADSWANWGYERSAPGHVSGGDANVGHGATNPVPNPAGASVPGQPSGSDGDLHAAAVVQRPDLTATAEERFGKVTITTTDEGDGLSHFLGAYLSRVLRPNPKERERLLALFALGLDGEDYAPDTLPNEVVGWDTEGLVRPILRAENPEFFVGPAGPPRGHPDYSPPTAAPTAAPVVDPWAEYARQAAVPRTSQTVTSWADWQPGDQIA